MVAFLVDHPCWEGVVAVVLSSSFHPVAVVAFVAVVLLVGNQNQVLVDLHVVDRRVLGAVEGAVGGGFDYFEYCYVVVEIRHFHVAFERFVLVII